EDDARVIVEQSTSAAFKPRVTREMTVHLSARDLVCSELAAPGCMGHNDAGPEPPPPSDAGRDAGAEPPEVDVDVDVDAGPPRVECVTGAGGDVCEPVNQCGCKGAAECQVDDDRGTCAVPGVSVQGELCARNRDCAAGLSCMAGACRTVCRSEADCASVFAQPSQCVRRSGAHFGFCALPCAKPGTPACVSGMSCSPLRGEGVQDSFCVRLEQPCSSTDNEVCDEPGRGTGFCAAGSDENDCCYEKRPQDWCDLVTQCGCPKGKACHPTNKISDDVWETGCLAAGSLPVGSPCTDDAQCERGAGCRAQLCKRYCSDAAAGGCASGLCLTFPKEIEIAANEGVGTCTVPCEWDTQKGCMPGTVCAQLRTGLSCYVQPAECPYYDDHVCDEPTRLCREGTDSDADCKR
ncbi:MAG TPA: hypothetical protein VMF89_28495, partial [Polyangiales bacterium]|nr:hypothetical protein [Polyangiales bacterium]